MPKKYKTKVYECLDDIIDYNYEERQIFRLENTRKRYNLKNFLKKQMDITEEERPNHKTPDTDADLITNNAHIVYEMCKYWFLKFMHSFNETPKLHQRINRLKRENEILHTRLSKALLENERLKQSNTEQPETTIEPESSSVDKILSQKYVLSDEEK